MNCAKIYKRLRIVSAVVTAAVMIGFAATGVPIPWVVGFLVVMALFAMHIEFSIASSMVLDQPGEFKLAVVVE